MKLRAVFKLQNTLLAHYLSRNVLVLFLAIFVVLSLVVFGNQLVLVLKASLQQGGLLDDLLPLIGLKVLRDVPLILSLSLFLALILSIVYLYKNSEAVVMNSLGLGDKHFIIFVQPMVVVVCLVILFLTTSTIPWSKNQRNIIIERNQNASEVSLIKAGKFQEFRQGNIVFYASKVNALQEMEDIFIYVLSDKGTIITLAKRAKTHTDPLTGSVYLRLKEGSRYHGFLTSENNQILSFDKYDLQISDSETHQTVQHDIKVEGKSTWDLLGSDDLQERAEFQWRIAQPLSTFILSILGILLGKTSPRHGRNLGVLAGIIIFVAYNNVLLIAKSSIEQGHLNPTVGLWWVHSLMLLMIAIYYAQTHGKLHFYRRKMMRHFFKGN